MTGPMHCKDHPMKLLLSRWLTGPKCSLNRQARLQVERLEGRELMSAVPLTPLPQPGDPIYNKYAQMGGSRSVLGTAVSAELDLKGGGQYQLFQHGAIYWPGSAGVYEIHGVMWDKYSAMGRQNGPLGLPTADVGVAARNGVRDSFQGGFIYWSSQSGAHVVWGAISARWLGMGAENGPLGFPLTDELVTPDGRGRYNHFQGGSIYWTPQTGAHVVWGSIRAEWAALGWERSALGYPLTDEMTTPDGRGRYNHFQGGSIYWTPQTGAHTVLGAIRDKWASLGWERSFLGYPTSDQYAWNGGLRSNFQGGYIFWTARGGAQVFRR
jgi:uncharacterized protein with LGFP repeats